MTIAEWLFEMMERLGKAGVDSPRRDALVLLEDTLDKDRSWVLAHPEYTLQAPSLETVNRLVDRRVQREPLAYIRGKAWFYGRFFEVTPAVMIPRPESESFIDLIKEITPETIIDIGTGSGCLAITASLELSDTKVVAIDDSREALKTARKNAQSYKQRIEFIHGSLLRPIQSTIYDLRSTLLMVNLPYVPDKLITSPEITQEPVEALFSGIDGLYHYREFWRQVDLLNQKPEFILTESLESQHHPLVELARMAGYALEKTEILVQAFKNTG